MQAQGEIMFPDHAYQ